MLNRLADLIRPRPLVDEVQRVNPAGATDLGQLPVGTELQARVAAALPNRVYQVVIGERVYTLPLPIDAQPGDDIQLTVVERDPPPTPAPHRPARADGGTVIILSPTARFITTLLNTPAIALLTGPVQAAAPPLLPAPPGDTAGVAARLSQALAASGMFYESHQAQWVAGARSLAQLMQEPQARIQPLPPADEPAAELASVVAAPAPAGESPRAPEAPVHPALRPLVREQLQALSTLQLAWHGQVWAGQDLYWEITEDAPQRGAAGDAAGTWQTRLTLKLPRLGDVRAAVSVGAAGVGITIAAAEGPTAETLSANAAALRTALVTAGLRPTSFRVERAKAAHG